MPLGGDGHQLQAQRQHGLLLLARQMDSPPQQGDGLGCAPLQLSQLGPMLMQARMLGIMPSPPAQGILGLSVATSLGQSLGITGQQAAIIFLVQRGLLLVQPGIGGGIFLSRQPQFQTQTAQLLAMPGRLRLGPVLPLSLPEGLGLSQQLLALRDGPLLQIQAQQLLIDQDIGRKEDASFIQLPRHRRLLAPQLTGRQPRQQQCVLRCFKQGSLEQRLRHVEFSQQQLDGSQVDTPIDIKGLKIQPSQRVTGGIQLAKLGARQRQQYLFGWGLWGAAGFLQQHKLLLLHQAAQ
ncbi:hypothetical protein D3C76_528500 [compost metagenome]